MNAQIKSGSIAVKCVNFSENDCIKIKIFLKKIIEPSKSTRDNKNKCGDHLRGRRLDGADCEYEEKPLETFAFIAD